MTTLTITPTSNAGVLAFPTPAAFAAPARFDVHEVDGFRSWWKQARAGGARRLVVDCSEIRFADLAAVEAIDEARVELDGGLELVRLSTAMTITLELLTGRSTELAVAA